jgi:hypothetical protein
MPGGFAAMKINNKWILIGQFRWRYRSGRALFSDATPLKANIANSSTNKVRATQIAAMSHLLNLFNFLFLLNNTEILEKCCNHF